MTLRDVEKVVTKYLIEHFNERGKKNFYFKSSKLPVKFDNKIIGRVLRKYIEPKGIIELWSTNNKYGHLWKTCFDGGEL